MDPNELVVCPECKEWTTVNEDCCGSFEEYKEEEGETE